MRFGTVKVETRGEQHFFEVQLYTQELDPDFLRVELYANGVSGGVPATLKMKQISRLEGSGHGYAYSGEVPSARPREDYTVRVIPYFSGVAVPLESHQVLWQR